MSRRKRLRPPLPRKPSSSPRLSPPKNPRKQKPPLRQPKKLKPIRRKRKIRNLKLDFLSRSRRTKMPSRRPLRRLRLQRASQSPRKLLPQKRRLMLFLRNPPLRRPSRLIQLLLPLQLPPSQLLRRRPKPSKMFREMMNLRVKLLMSPPAMKKAKNQARRVTTLVMMMKPKALRRKLPKSEDY